MMKAKIRSMLISQDTVLYAIIAVMLILVYILVPKDGDEIDVVNSDASYHTLCMVKNFQDYSISEHAFIPTVTMKNGAPTEWGPCVKGEDGKYYYCSFMPLDVIIPYLFFALSGLELTIENLHILSLILAFINIVILEKIIFTIFSDKIYNRLIIAILDTMIYIFSAEGIQCSANVFWGELLFQPIMLTVIYLLIIRSEKNTYIHIPFGVALGCLVDWSAYCFAIIVTTVLLVKGIREHNSKEIKAACGTSIATLLAGVITILHYSIKIGIAGYLEYCKRRFGDRGIGTNVYEVSIFDLLKGYYESYGIWIILTIVAFIGLQYYQRKTEHIDNLNLVLGLVGFTCIENILMLEHAVEYRYDRLKVAPIIVICLIGIMVLLWNYSIARWISVALVTSLSLFYMISYSSGSNGYVAKNVNYYDNKVLADYLVQEILNDNQDNILVGINPYCPVEGYGNLLLNRNIVAINTMNDPVENFRTRAKTEGYSGFVYILTDYNLAEKYHLLGFLVGSTDDYNIKYYYVSDGNNVKSIVLDKSQIRAMPISDKAFISGVDIANSTIRFNKNPILEQMLQSGLNLVSANGNSFSVESVTVFDECIDVRLTGDISWWYMQEFEYPNTIEIR